MILIQISEIIVNPGRRAALPEDVRVLAENIAENGLLNPITLDKHHKLIAGLHRLEAVKLLSWTEIECTISDLEGLQAELAEIDENFVRKDLTLNERSDLLHRRKAIYERLFPETKATYEGGAFRGNQYGEVVAAPSAATTLQDSFVRDTSKKTGISERTIREDLQLAKNLVPGVKKIIDGAEKKITKKEALKLSHLEPDQQKEAAEQLASGKTKSVDEYMAERDTAKSSLPFQMTRRTFSSIEESVADLKNMDKDCSSTPGDFLAEVTAFVQKFRQEIEWFNNPYYEEVFPDINDEQREYLRQQMEIVSAAAKKLYKSVERKSKK